MRHEVCKNAENKGTFFYKCQNEPILKLLRLTSWIIYSLMMLSLLHLLIMPKILSMLIYCP